MNKCTNTPSEKIANALEIIPDSRIAEVLIEGMSATVTTRSGMIEPDTRTRIQSAALALSYKVGRPSVAVPPPASQDSNGQSADDIIEKMVLSEAYFTAMETQFLDMIEKAKARRAELKAEKK